MEETIDDVRGIYRVNYIDKELVDADYTKADFRGSTFTRVNFIHCKLLGTDFRECKFIDCTFPTSSLYKCDFRHCYFENIDFTDSTLSYCDFRHCSHRDTILTEAQIEKSDVRDSMFKLTKPELIDSEITPEGEPITEITYQVSPTAELPFTADSVAPTDGATV